MPERKQRFCDGHNTANEKTAWDVWACGYSGLRGFDYCSCPSANLILSGILIPLECIKSHGLSESQSFPPQIAMKRSCLLLSIEAQKEFNYLEPLEKHYPNETS